MTNDASLSAAILAELKEMNMWLRVLAEPVLKERLRAQLKDDIDRRVYTASTGISTREVEALTKASKSRVAASWARWASAGIMRPTSIPGRFERILDPAILGLDDGS